ncbi:MAG: hypothetical protein P8Y26_11865 [Gemmatimonadales bacterium]
MDFATLVRSRLAKLGCAQKDLALAAQVADSYISQLLTRKRPPPAPDRTDIYPKMEAFLRLEPGALGRLAGIERTEELKHRLGQTPEPLFQGFRDLILAKCVAQKRDEVRGVFERHPFGTLERLITQKLLDVVQRIARQELDSENWIRLAARVGSRVLGHRSGQPSYRHYAEPAARRRSATPLRVRRNGAARRLRRTFRIR